MDSRLVFLRPLGLRLAVASTRKRREKADCRTVDLVSGLSLTLCGSDELREIEVDV